MNKTKPEETQLNDTQKTSNENVDVQDPMELLNKIDLSVKDRQVLLVFGESTLIIDDGQMFIEETRNPKNRKQIPKIQAKEIFLEHSLKLLKQNKEVVEIDVIE